MQFMFTYIRKPVRLTWVWYFFFSDWEACKHTPWRGGAIPSWTEQASWTPQPFSWSEAKSRAGTCPSSLLGGPSGLPLPALNWGTNPPILGKMGKPVSLTALPLCLLLLRGTPRCSHPGSRGRGVAQPLTPQLLPEQTQCFAVPPANFLCGFCTLKIYRGNNSSTLDIPESVFYWARVSRPSWWANFLIFLALWNSADEFGVGGGRGVLWGERWILKEVRVNLRGILKSTSRVIVCRNRICHFFFLKGSLKLSFFIPEKQNTWILYM